MSLAVAEIIGLAGLVLCLTGAWLHWGMPRRLAHLEDEHKDGDLSEDQAMLRRQIWTALVPVTVILGVVLIGAALYGRLG
ncbi:MAG: hypothetical protein KIT44_11080 [Opitutaceae bacterium]|nr:hypothetical protein [Opitutaceae bacterium]